MKKLCSCTFLYPRCCQTMTSEFSGGSICEQIWPGAGFKACDVGEEYFGGLP